MKMLSGLNDVVNVKIQMKKLFLLEGNLLNKITRLLHPAQSFAYCKTKFLLIASCVHLNFVFLKKVVIRQYYNTFKGMHYLIYVLNWNRGPMTRNGCY